MTVDFCLNQTGVSHGCFSANGTSQSFSIGVLIMYRPNFCAECAAKIIRLRWQPWTNRKFCERCSPRFAKEQMIQVAIAGAVLFLVGLAVGRAARPATPPLLIERKQASQPSLASASQKLPATTRGTTTSTDEFGANAGAGDPSTSQSALTDEVYMCGARTKKGTPCTRRVHGPVRCWQHKGMPAMLPQDKLIVKE
jgi:hypothetical protein